MDALDKARMNVMSVKHQFIMQLGNIGKDAAEIKAILELIDWNLEIENATNCFGEWEKQHAATVVQTQGQSQSGS